MLDTSDLILTLGIKFWASLVQERNIKELEEGHHIISQIRLLLKTNKAEYCEPFNTDDLSYFQKETQDEEDEGKAEYIWEEESKGDVMLDVLSFAPVSTTTSDDHKAIKKQEAKCDELIRVKPLTEDQVAVADCDPSLSSLSTDSQTVEEVAAAEKTKALSCELCEFRCEEDRRLYRHLIVHHRKEASCRHCGKLFNQSGQLRDHEMGHTSLGTLFKCDDCDKQFAQKKHLKRHQARHTALPLQCNLCDKQYKNRRALRLHEKTHANPTSSPVPCPICGLSFKNSHGMEIHKSSHGGPRDTPEANVKCRFCDLILTSQSRKARHEFEVHDNNSHVCTQCGKKFNGSTAYETHLTTHSNLRIPCETCGKVFAHKLQLIRHELNLHQADSEKRYQCSFSGCNRAFNKSDSLESHMNSHLGIKPYQCDHDLCEARFQNKSNMFAHFKKVHRKCSS